VAGTDLAQQQRESLWLDGHSGLYTVADALSFMNEVGVALRYGAAARAADCEHVPRDATSSAHSGG